MGRAFQQEAPDREARRATVTDSGGVLGDLDPPGFGALLQIGPGELTRIFGLKLIVEWFGVVVVHKDETLARLQLVHELEDFCMPLHGDEAADIDNIGVTGCGCCIGHGPWSLFNVRGSLPMAGTMATLLSYKMHCQYTLSDRSGNLPATALVRQGPKADSDTIFPDPHKKGRLMRLTSFSDYALRVLMYAHSRKDRLVTIEETANAYGISRAHLMKVVNILTRSEFLLGVRGRSGGFTLARPANEINLGAVIRATEPDFALVECFNPDNRCAIAHVCGLPIILNEALGAFIGVLDRHTLADITVNPGDFALPGDGPAPQRGPELAPAPGPVPEAVVERAGSDI